MKNHQEYYPTAPILTSAESQKRFCNKRRREFFVGLSSYQFVVRIEGGKGYTFIISNSFVIFQKIPITKNPEILTFFGACYQSFSIYIFQVFVPGILSLYTVLQYMYITVHYSTVNECKAYTSFTHLRLFQRFKQETNF